MAITGIAQDLFQELQQIPTIDAHEHLPPEASRIKEPQDFYSLFKHYCTGDLISAGATEEDIAVFADQNIDLGKRWERFHPFLDAIRTGGYARSALLFVKDVLELPDLNDETYTIVSDKLNEMNRPGIYDRILKERCNIAACIQCWQLENGPFPDYFYHLAPGPMVVDLISREAITCLEAKCDQAIHSLNDALKCMTNQINQWCSHPKVVGVKSAHAYGRSIAFQRITRKDADNVFNRVLTKGENSPSEQELIPLQDFLMFELVARLEASAFPMVFHTGLQAGNFNHIANADPLHLQTLLSEFPRAKIDLFHGGMPWVREIAVLAKYFPGVHLNMAWMHIISPTQARSALSEWLDMIPNNKIFGFGGDYGIVEKVYGHLKLARQNIALVLAEKIEHGAMSRSEASMVAQRLMHDNANHFYKMELNS